MSKHKEGTHMGTATAHMGVAETMRYMAKQQGQGWPGSTSIKNKLLKKPKSVAVVEEG